MVSSGRKSELARSRYCWMFIDCQSDVKATEQQISHWVIAPPNVLGETKSWASPIALWLEFIFLQQWSLIQLTRCSISRRFSYETLLGPIDLLTNLRSLFFKARCLIGILFFRPRSSFKRSTIHMPSPFPPFPTSSQNGFFYKYIFHTFCSIALCFIPRVTLISLLFWSR